MNLTRSGKASSKMTHLCNLWMCGLGVVVCASGMVERIGQQSIEIEKNLQTGFFLRQIINIATTVMYHNGRVDICILEGKYKDLVQH